VYLRAAGCREVADPSLQPRKGRSHVVFELETFRQRCIQAGSIGMALGGVAGCAQPPQAAAGACMEVEGAVDVVTLKRVGPRLVFDSEVLRFEASGEAREISYTVRVTGPGMQPFLWSCLHSETMLLEAGLARDTTCRSSAGSLIFTGNGSCQGAVYDTSCTGIDCPYYSFRRSLDDQRCATRTLLFYARQEGSPASSEQRALGGVVIDRDQLNILLPRSGPAWMLVRAGVAAAAIDALRFYWGDQCQKRGPTPDQNLL